MSKHNPIIYRVLRHPARWLIRGLYRLKVVNIKGIPEKGPVVLACNHMSNFDGITVMATPKRTVFFLAKDNLFKNKIGRWLFTNIGAIPVNRREKDQNCRNAAINCLNDGNIIGIFPEGTRNKTDDLTLPFKFGAVSFAKKTDATLIPCAITGKYRMFRKGLKITIGKPIDISKLSLEEANALLEKTIGHMIVAGNKI